MKKSIGMKIMATSLCLSLAPAALTAHADGACFGCGLGREIVLKSQVQQSSNAQFQSVTVSFVPASIAVAGAFGNVGPFSPVTADRDSFVATFQSKVENEIQKGLSVDRVDIRGRFVARDQNGGVIYTTDQTLIFRAISDEDVFQEISSATFFAQLTAATAVESLVQAESATLQLMGRPDGTATRCVLESSVQRLANGVAPGSLAIFHLENDSRFLGNEQNDENRPMSECSAL